MKTFGSAAGDAFTITPSDTTNFDKMTDAIFIGGDGNIAVVKKDGTAITFTGVIAGQVLPINAIRVNSTGTTATNLVGLTYN